MLDDIRSLVEKLGLLTQNGKSDEDAIVELFREGTGVLFLSRALAAERNLTTKNAQRLVLNWTRSIEQKSLLSQGLRVVKEGMINNISDKE